MFNVWATLSTIVHFPIMFPLTDFLFETRIALFTLDLLGSYLHTLLISRSVPGLEIDSPWGVLSRGWSTFFLCGGQNLDICFWTKVGVQVDKWIFYWSLAFIIVFIHFLLITNEHISIQAHQHIYYSYICLKLRHARTRKIDNNKYLEFDPVNFIVVIIPFKIYTLYISPWSCLCVQDVLTINYIPTPPDTLGSRHVEWMLAQDYMVCHAHNVYRGSFLLADKTSLKVSQGEGLHIRNN